MLDALGDFLAPRTCPACREDLPLWVQGPLCGSCLSRVRPLRGTVCRRCGVPWSEPEPLCRRCRAGLFAVDVIRAAFAYASPVRELLHAFKYRGRQDAGTLLADWQAGLYARRPEVAGSQAVVPVPLHPKRLRERGFNQAERLARAVARAAGLPCLTGLTRLKNTAARWTRSRAERVVDLEDAFRWDGPPPPLRVLLVDDVCTSSGTLEACARALQRSGCESIQAYVLARD